MIFSYKEITPHISRPIIPLILKTSGMFILYEGLVDSGADYSIFSLEIAQKLGIKLSNKKEAHFLGVGKDEVKGFFSAVELRIGDVSYQAKVIFAEISDFGHGILEQKGFFDHFDVRLSYQKQMIELESAKTKRSVRN